MRCGAVNNRTELHRTVRENRHVINPEFFPLRSRAVSYLLVLVLMRCTLQLHVLECIYQVPI